MAGALSSFGGSFITGPLTSGVVQNFSFLGSRAVKGLLDACVSLSAQGGSSIHVGGLSTLQPKSVPPIPSVPSGSRHSLAQLAAQRLIYEAAKKGAHSQAFRRHAHSESLFMHHVSSQSRDPTSSAIPLGLMASLERHVPNIGYFRPVGSSQFTRTELIKQAFDLKDSLDEMQAISQADAYELLAAGRMDELLDRVLTGFEEYRKKYDFVLVEGSNFSETSSQIETSHVNAKIASTLGTPAMLVVNVQHGPRAKANQRSQQPTAFEDVKHDLVNSILLTASAFNHEHVPVVGALSHGMPKQYADRDIQQLIRDKLGEHNVFYAGCIPEDSSLTACTVHDVKRQLGAELLYGGHIPGQMSTEVTQFVVATIQLQDLLEYLPRHVDPTKGVVVITNSDRPDILLGMLSLQGSSKLANVAAVVLTGSDRPSAETDMILKLWQQHNPHAIIPVLLARIPTFDAANLLGNVEGQITPTSSRKIERAQVLFDENIWVGPILRTLDQEQTSGVNPKLFEFNIFRKAKENKQHIVLPEGYEPRIVSAAGEVLRKGLADVTLLGDKERVLTVAKQLRVDLSKANIVDPLLSPNLPEYQTMLYEARKNKGLTMDGAHSQLTADVNFFGTAMVQAGHADGMVSGSIHTTANTVRPALQLIKTDPNLPLVSSIFFMCLSDKVLAYGDCAINTNPTAEELATIAISSADTAAAFGIEPRIAMLSYATGDSNTGPIVQKVADATALVRQQRPDLPVEGPIQYDAAVNPETAKTKFKGKPSLVAGQATVLIFPDLNTGNNTYKAVQQSTGAVAMGPVLQGLRKPVNDLSRGCTVKDVVTTIAITAIQAHSLKHKSATQDVPAPEAKAEVGA